MKLGMATSFELSGSAIKKMSASCKALEVGAVKIFEVAMFL
jgi:hypothetical protein